MPNISDIKLIRTDTTLDLSQKAEKRYRVRVFESLYPASGVLDERGRSRLQLSIPSHLRSFKDNAALAC